MVAVTDSPLRQLIQTSLDAKSWTLADLHRATKRLDPGGKGVAYSSLAAWMSATKARSMPRPENLDLVARALGLDATTLHAAARAAGGYRVDELTLEDPELQVFAADYQKMSPTERARLMRIIQATMNDPDLFPSRRRRNGN